MPCKYYKRRSSKRMPYCKLKREFTPNCDNCKDKEYKQYKTLVAKTPFKTKTPLKRGNKPIKKVSKKRIFVSKGTYNQVYQECNGKCALCGTIEALQYHHIHYRSEAKHLIDEPKNGIMLCVNCHKLVHSNKKKWQPVLIEMRNKKGE